jgi:hypothetical protein
MIWFTEKFWYELREVDRVMHTKEKWLMRRSTMWFLGIPIFVDTVVIHR